MSINKLKEENKHNPQSSLLLYTLVLIYIVNKVHNIEMQLPDH